VGDNFAFYMFYGCSGADFTMSETFNLPSGITTVGNNFASYMFSGCYGSSFTMNKIFSMPSGITAVGNNFAIYMFSGCRGNSFMMGEAFNLPSGITSAGNNFASYMFSDCYGASFTMNEIFNLPSGITTVGDNFASNMFSGCYGASFTMGEAFNLPSGITTIGTDFASNMFSGCYGASFTMNEIFNMPSGITTARNNFASNMFSNCSGTSFTMNEVFNMPSGITVVSDNFASNMFSGCYGASFTMNEVFNMPHVLTSAGDYFARNMFYNCSGASFTMNEIFNLPTKIPFVNHNFAYYMFSGCSGASFTMNEVFNLPNEIAITVGNYFAANIFSGCSGASFTMNEVFNLPSLITYVGTDFASNMFYGCSGTAFMVNNEFKFPILELDQLNKSNVFYQTFYNSGNASTPQTRTATSIINNNPSPTGYSKQTFTGSRFPDLAYIPTVWGGGGSSITVTFASNGGSAVTPINNVAVGTPISEPEAPARTGSAFAGWYKDAALTSAWNFETDKVVASITLYAKWSAYTVSFNLNGITGTAPSVIYITPPGGTLGEEQKPSTSGFTRSGYAHDGNWHTRTGAEETGYVYTEFVFGTGGTPVTGDVTLYLKWTPIYTVSFDLNGDGYTVTGTTPASIANVLSGSTLSEEQKPPTSDFTRSGYANDGKWYTRTGGTMPGTTMPGTYVYTEFIFGEGGTEVASNITLYLKWLPFYSVSFTLDGGTGTPPASIADVLSGSTLSEAQKPPTSGFTRSGYANDGKWYVRTASGPYVYTEFVFGEDGTEVTSNVTLYLKWTPTYTVSFDLNGESYNPVTGTTPASIANLLSGSTLSETQKPSTSGFTRSSYSNDGKWYTRSVYTPYVYTEFVFGEDGTEVTSSITLYLKWTPTYTVSFDLNGESYNPVTGTTPASIANLSPGSTLSETQKPSTSGFTRSGYVNDGKWYTRTYTEFVFGEDGTEVTGDITLYLNWTRTYTVSFDLDGGTGTAPDSIANLFSGSTLSEAQKPQTDSIKQANYVNDGKWYARTIHSPYGVYTEFVFGEDGTKVTSDITLYLKWTPLYTVSFDLNGGTGSIIPAPIANVLSGSTLSEEQMPSILGFTRPYYKPDGKWYIKTGNAYTEFIFGTGGTPVTSDITLYLKWEAETPIIKSIAANGFGIVQNGKSFQIVGTSQATPIRIYNLHGKMLMNRTAMPNESISVSHLPKGVYLIQARETFRLTVH
jgi:uncharacterized repeat protein (TIGR02543 family)